MTAHRFFNQPKYTLKIPEAPNNDSNAIDFTILKRVPLTDRGLAKRTIPEVNHAINECTICLSKPSDSVIGPCGHGGICFECCQ